MKSVYLSHNMASKEYGRALQQKIEALGVKVYNPFREVEQSVDVSSETNYYKARNIVAKELDAISNSNAIVTVVTDDWAAGSHMESALGVVKFDKPCFVLWLARPYSRMTPHHIWYDVLATVYDSEATLLRGLEMWANVETSA